MGRHGPGVYELMLAHSGRVDAMGILGALTRRLADCQVQNAPPAYCGDGACHASPGQCAPPVP